MPFGFVFPGQGSQSVGMLSGLGAAVPVRATFDEASAILSYDLWQLVEQGPEERLNSTEYTQPAMLAAGIATSRLWLERGGAEPTVVSGHSLGEFTALVCSKALDFETALDLVRFRGQAMQEAVPTGSGAMAAILGLEDADVEQACRDAAQGGVVEAVNFNAPGQVVIAGESAAVQRAIEAAKARGAKRAIALPVSVPSHSSLMRGAAERLGERLAGTEIRKPEIQYISAVDAKPHSDPDDIRALLVRQLASPVRWQDTVRALVATGIQQLIECGPGKVLTGLNRRIDRQGATQFLSLDDAETIEANVIATRGTADV
jgi:[acyl-carrier-protein] S-malonyltransferase